MNKNKQVIESARMVLKAIRNLERTEEKTRLYYSLECKINQVELEIFSGQVDPEFAEEMVENLFKIIVEEAQWASVTVVK